MSELRRHVEVEVDVLGSPSLIVIVCTTSVDVKQCQQKRRSARCMTKN